MTSVRFIGASSLWVPGIIASSGAVALQRFAEAAARPFAHDCQGQPSGRAGSAAESEQARVKGRLLEFASE